MAKIWADKLPTVDEVYKLYDQEKFQDFKLAAAILAQADTKLPKDHVMKLLPVYHVITIAILAANVVEDHSIATKLLAIAQQHYHNARAVDQQPAGVRGLDRLREILDKVGKAIELREWSQEEDGERGGESESEQGDGEESSLDDAKNDEAVKTQNHKEQERQDELVCEICLAGLQGQEAFNAHQAQCKLMQAQAKIRWLEHELERQKKEKAIYTNRLRVTLELERKALVTKIQESQAQIEEIDVLLE